MNILMRAVWFSLSLLSAQGFSDDTRIEEALTVWETPGDRLTDSELRTLAEVVRTNTRPNDTSVGRRLVRIVRDDRLEFSARAQAFIVACHVANEADVRSALGAMTAHLKSLRQVIVSEASIRLGVDIGVLFRAVGNTQRAHSRSDHQARFCRQ